MYVYIYIYIYIYMARKDCHAQRCGSLVDDDSFCESFATGLRCRVMKVSNLAYKRSPRCLDVDRFVETFLTIRSSEK